jgi:hypothetical protein
LIDHLDAHERHRFEVRVLRGVLHERQVEHALIGIAGQDTHAFGAAADHHLGDGVRDESE